MKTWVGILAGVIGLGLGVALGPVDACAQVTRADTAPTTLLYFASAHRNARPVMPPHEIRQLGEGAMERALRGWGAWLKRDARMEEKLRRHRIRSADALPAAFLGELEAGQLVLAHLAIFPDGVLLYARALDVETGRVLWAGLSERRFADPGPEDLGHWGVELAMAAWDLLRRVTRGPSDAAPSLLLLPTDGEYRAEASARLLGHAVLETLLRERRWAITDASVVAGRLLGAGRNPRLSGQVGEELGSVSLLRPTLVSESPPRRTVRAAEDDAIAAEDQALREPFYCSLRLIDGTSGAVDSATDRFLPPVSREGVFGTLRHISWTDRFTEAAEGLVRTLDLPR